MQEFWYYETKLEDTRSRLKRWLSRIGIIKKANWNELRMYSEKWLLVKDDAGELKYKYNLTRLGIEYINTFAELQELFPPVHYDYKSGKSIE